MNWAKLKSRLSLFDKQGLEPDTIKMMNVMSYAVMGGVVWMNITSGIAMTGFIKLLGVNDFLYGVIMMLPAMANALQFLVSYWMEKTLARKRLFLVSGLIQRVIWIPFALVPFLVPMSQPQLRIWIVVVCAAVSAGTAPFVNVSFMSMCADVVPMRMRGRYFAARGRLSSAAGLIVGLAVGVLLDKLPGFTGYCAVFLLAAVFGIFDIACFFRVKFPPMRPALGNGRLVPMLRQVLSDRPYMKMVLALTAWLFAVSISSPYYNVYVKDIMRMSNLMIILSGQIVASLGQILAISRWGRALDNYGSRPILQIAGLIVSFYPLIFFFTGPNMVYLVFLSNIISGATYCAIDLGAQSLYMKQAGEQNKSMYFAVYFIITQLMGAFLGSATGGWLLDNVLWRMEALNLHALNTPLTRYNWLYLISWALRFGVAAFIFPLMREDTAQGWRTVLKDAHRSILRSARSLWTYGARRKARRRYGKQKQAGGTL